MTSVEREKSPRGGGGEESVTNTGSDPPVPAGSVPAGSDPAGSESTTLIFHPRFR